MVIQRSVETLFAEFYIIPELHPATLLQIFTSQVVAVM